MRLRYQTLKISYTKSVLIQKNALSARFITRDQD